MSPASGEGELDERSRIAFATLSAVASMFSSVESHSVVPVPELVLRVLGTQATRVMCGSTNVTSTEGGRIRI